MTKTNHSPLRAIVIVTLIVVAAMSILVASSSISLRIAKKSAPLIDAAMEIKYELSLYHLWLEELVQKDPTVSREQVWQHLNQARWYAHAMLEGGENRELRYQALDQPALRSMIREELDQMDQLEAVGLGRLERARNSLAGSDQDQAFDKFFTKVLKFADDVETAIQQNIAAEIRRFEGLVYILGAMVILVGVAGGILFFLIERRRESDYALLLEGKGLLQREQTLLRSLIDSVPDLIFFKDREGVYLGCNKAFEKFTGRVGSRIVGITDLEIFTPELGEFFREKDRQMLTEGKPRRNEEWVDYPDGRRVLLDTLKTPYYGPDGEMLGLIGVSRDISERYRVGERLRKSQIRLSEAQRLAHIGNWELDPQTGELWWSDEIFRIFEIDQEQFGSTYEGFLGVIHPEDREKVNRAYTESLRDRSPYEIVHRLLLADGRIKFVHERCESSFDDRGKPLKSIGTVQDITEHQQAQEAVRASEQRLSLLMNTLPHGIQENDTEGLITYSNIAHHRILGWNHDELIGQYIWDSQAGNKSKQELRDYLAYLVAEQPPPEPHVNHNITRDGREVILEVAWDYLRNAAGVVTGFISVISDITDRKRAEEEIRRLNLELEDRVRERTSELQVVNEELESFAYSVSHDLRTPLRAIDGFSLALAEDYAERLDETALDYLQRVRSGAQRMGMLIDDLLQLSRVNRGELTLQEVDMGKIAEAVVEEFRAGEPGRQVELRLDRDMLVQGDPRLLRVMLDNLLGNAWKFTAREAVSCINFQNKVDQPGVFYISDNGVGFDMRHAAKLFGAFQRLHRVTDFPGTGVGLATVQRIVHRHRGRIWAEAREGDGAAFYFSLGPTKGAQEEQKANQGET